MIGVDERMEQEHLWLGELDLQLLLHQIDTNDNLGQA